MKKQITLTLLLLGITAAIPCLAQQKQCYYYEDSTAASVEKVTITLLITGDKVTVSTKKEITGPGSRRSITSSTAMGIIAGDKIYFKSEAKTEGTKSQPSVSLDTSRDKTWTMVSGGLYIDGKKIPEVSCGK